MANTSFIKLSGFCMLPLIKNGEVAHVSKKDIYKLGDIVVYNFRGKQYCHRLMIKQANKYYMWDDMGFFNGHWVDRSDVIGCLPRNIMSGFLGAFWSIILRNINFIKEKI